MRQNSVVAVLLYCAFAYGCTVYCVRTCRVSSPGVLNVFGCGNGPALTSTSVRFADEFLRIHNCAIVSSEVDHSTQLHSSVTWCDLAHIIMYRLSIKTCWSARSIPMSVCSTALESTDRPKILLLSFTSYLHDTACMHTWVSANQLVH